MKNLFGLIAFSVIVSACSPDSRITSSWKKPKFKGSYTDVMVTALTPGIDARVTIEDDLAAALAARDIRVSKSMDILPPNFSKETQKEEMMRKIRHTSSKAIITVSLLHKETKSTYVPGSYGYAPTYTYYGGFWGYYSFWYPAIATPGYYEQDKVYYMETNVYDVATEELVWSAQSETYNPDDVSGFSRELADILATKLTKDGVVRPPKIKVDRAEKDVSSRNP